MENQETTLEELKVNALLERIAQLENEKADLRVMVTVLNQRNQQLEEKLTKYEEDQEDTSDVSNNVS